jgi:L-lactate dehydrogenase complex protein LldG
MATASLETKLWSAFTAKAELIGAVVLHAPNPAAVPGLLDEAPLVATASVGRRFPELVGQFPEPNEEPALQVLAAAAFAVAETGSVGLDEPRLDRGACFLAEHLWVLVRATDVLPTLEPALERMHTLVHSGARHPLLMSGPSRTADIERVLTVGVHGPRKLTIVIVDQE